MIRNQKNGTTLQADKIQDLNPGLQNGSIGDSGKMYNTGTVHTNNPHSVGGTVRHREREVDPAPLTVQYCWKIYL